MLDNSNNEQRYIAFQVYTLYRVGVLAVLKQWYEPFGHVLYVVRRHVVKYAYSHKVFQKFDE